MKLMKINRNKIRTIITLFVLFAGSNGQEHSAEKIAALPRFQHTEVGGRPRGPPPPTGPPAAATGPPAAAEEGGLFVIDNWHIKRDGRVYRVSLTYQDHKS